MLPGMMALPAMQSMLLPSVSFLNDASIVGAAASYTFSNVNIGEASPDRKIVVGIVTFDSAGVDYAVSGVTVAGLSAAEIIQDTLDIGASSTNLALFRCDVPLGTSGNVVVNLNTGVNRCGIGVWRLIHKTGVPSSYTHVQETNNNVSTDNIVMPGNGVGIAMGFSWEGGSSTPTASWSGTANPTQVLNKNVGTFTNYLGATFNSSGILTVSGGVGDRAGIAAATWGPL